MRERERAPAGDVLSEQELYSIFFEEALHLTRNRNHAKRFAEEALNDFLNWRIELKRRN